AICLSPCLQKVKGRIAAPFAAAASLQGCGGCGRGGVLAPKPQNDKEMRGFFCRFCAPAVVTGACRSDRPPPQRPSRGLMDARIIPDQVGGKGARACPILFYGEVPSLASS